MTNLFKAFVAVIRIFLYCSIHISKYFFNKKSFQNDFLLKINHFKMIFSYFFIILIKIIFKIKFLQSDLFRKTAPF